MASEILNEIEQLGLGSEFGRRDVPCPRCASTNGCDVMDTYPDNHGRHRDRQCNDCKYRFRTYEKFPEYDGQPFPRQYDDDHVIPDSACPRCRSMRGSIIKNSRPTDWGRHRERIGICCGYQFRTFEPYPKYEDHHTTSPTARAR